MDNEHAYLGTFPTTLTNQLIRRKLMSCNRPYTHSCSCVVTLANASKLALCQHPASDTFDSRFFLTVGFSDLRSSHFGPQLPLCPVLDSPHTHMAQVPYAIGAVLELLSFAPALPRTLRVCLGLYAFTWAVGCPSHRDIPRKALGIAKRIHTIYQRRHRRCHIRPCRHSLSFPAYPSCILKTLEQKMRNG
jgi:hypothetical protein